ncbi:hypothetical protein V9T40_006572 [Parthenolecanium corni]|uniref:Uncharacterized protein n=1 Tax=Parthenolecanium corni TaxID=536013 RepID=A0AAN9TPR6_9HEMI
MLSLIFRIAILIVTLNFLRICELAEYQPNNYALVTKREGEVKACGPILADLLALTCENKYHYQGKRADRTSENVPDSDYYYNYETYPADVIGAYPFRSKRSVASILRSTKRNHGLFEECFTFKAQRGHHFSTLRVPEPLQTRCLRRMLQKGLFHRRNGWLLRQPLSQHLYERKDQMALSAGPAGISPKAGHQGPRKYDSGTWELRNSTHIAPQR